IHRRGLWQTGAAYLGIAWAVLEVMDLFTGRGILPDWTFTGALVALVLGLPVVLATAFVQTPRKVGASVPGEGSGGVDGISGVVEASGVEGSSVGTPGKAEPENSGRPRSLKQLFTWRRAILGGVLAFSVLGVSTAGFGIMRVMGIGAPGTLLAQGVFEEGGLVILADFESTAGSTAPSDLVTEALRIDLEQSPTFDLMDPRAVSAGLARMVRDPDEPLTEDLALELATREGAEVVVSGDVGSVGGGYLLTGRILSAEDGALLAAFRETARDSTQLIDAMDALSGKVRSKMGEALRSVAGSDPLFEATTTSLEALRKFTYVSHREPRGAIPGPRAIQVIEEAVALDTTFAEAYRYLSILINNYGGSVQQGADAATRAFQHRRRLSPRRQLLVEGNYHMAVTGDYDQAARAYTGLVELDSLDSTATTNLADIVMYAGEYAEAERLLVSAPRPEMNVWTWNLMVSLAGQEKYSEAERLLEDASVAQPDNMYLPFTKGLFYASQGRSGEALATLGGIESAPDAVRYWAAYAAAVAHAQAGNLGLARDRLAQTDEWLKQTGTPSDRIAFEASKAFVSAWLAGDRRQGMKDLDALLSDLPMEEMDPVDRSLGRLALLYAVIGAPEEAQSFVDQYRAEVPSEGDPTGRSMIRVAEALVRIMGGSSPSEAGLESAASRLRCLRCARFYLGHGFQLADDAEKAIDAYEAYVQDGFFDASLYEMHFPAPVVHERLGVLYEEVGNPEKAAQHYREFARRWANADPDLQPRVQRALERAAELGV
ncbi:MAG: tetratricopeptide repeat protein, partial [Gemmatimonadetes bacterium]|nr:tetratricopeptide repeat protein [Gemmatimonadota bacterium]